MIIQIGLGIVAALIAAEAARRGVIDGDEVAVAVAIALGVLAVGLIASAWKGWSSAAAAAGVALLLVAIYLPLINPEHAVVEWFGKAYAGDDDQADAVALVRWVLVVAGILLVAWPGREVGLEAVLAGVAVVAVAAVAGAVVELGARVAEKDAVEVAKADADMSFSIPADKIQPVTAKFAADTCVRIVLVRATDRDTADGANELTYTRTRYDGRLPSELASGAPLGGVVVELKQGGLAGQFAMDLTAAKEVYLLGCR